MDNTEKDHQILVVDDDHAIRETLIEVLKLEGYLPTGAAHGKEGLQYLQTTRPCIILLDWMMPIMSGEEFMIYKNSDQSLASIPVIVISAAGNIERKANVGGIAAFINKPLHLNELFDKIQKYCDCRTHPTQSNL